MNEVPENVVIQRERKTWMSAFKVVLNYWQGGGGEGGREGGLCLQQSVVSIRDLIISKGARRKQEFGSIPGRAENCTSYVYFLRHVYY